MFSQTTDIMYSYNQRLTYDSINTKTESKAENKNLDYDFRVLGELNYAFISLLAIKLVEWGVKSFSETTDIMNSYNQRLTYMTESKAEIRI